MEAIPQQSTISVLSYRKHRINLSPEYQRGAVWSLEKKQLLIDTILRGYDIPKIYVRKLPDGQPHDWEVVDGQQRLTAIFEFSENKFSLGQESDDFPSHPDWKLSGKYFSDLNGDQLGKLQGFQVALTELRDAGDIEIRELFLRLQEGVSLNPPEKRNAMVGAMRDFIDDIAKNSPIFIKTTAPNKRFEHADYAAHVVALEMAGGPCHLKAEDLKRLYKNNETFDPNSSTAKKVKQVLNYMNQMFDESCPELKIKWGFVDIYWLISRLLDSHDIARRHNDLANFYLAFENDRKAVSDPADLIGSGGTAEQKDLYDYIDSFQRDGANRDKIDIRADVYLRKFLSSYPNVAAKDPKRQFSEQERIVIWRRGGMTCAKCRKLLSDLSDMHADHITPHSKGGKTTIDNAQSLCVSCNTSKGNR